MNNKKSVDTLGTNKHFVDVFGFDQYVDEISKFTKFIRGFRSCQLKIVVTPKLNYKRKNILITFGGKYKRPCLDSVEAMKIYFEMLCGVVETKYT